MTLSQIRSRVNTLQRRYALALSVVRARRVAEQLCNQWDRDLSEGKSLPDPSQVVQKVKEAGIRNAAFMGLHNYIQTCADGNKCPNPRDFLDSLLPRASTAGLVREAMRWDAAA